MSGIVIAQLILEFGVPAAEQIYNMVTSTTAPTASDWANLKALTSTNASDAMKAQLAAAGIAPTDPRYAAFMALVA